MSVNDIISARSRREVASAPLTEEVNEAKAVDTCPVKPKVNNGNATANAANAHPSSNKVPTKGWTGKEEEECCGKKDSKKCKKCCEELQSVYGVTEEEAENLLSIMESFQ